MTSFQAQWLTLGIILVLTIVVVWYDILAASAWGSDATISRTLAYAFRRFPILYPIFWFAVGLFVGHLGLPSFVE
jgi:hypothetical protein